MTNVKIVDLHGNNIHIEINGIQIAQIKVPSDYVPYTFAPILGTHDLLTGDKLRNGMIVVLEDNQMRDNPERLSPEYPDRARGFRPTEYDRASIAEKSRWAIVTDIEQDGSTTKFTAIYADGTMCSRAYAKSYKWASLIELDVLLVCRNCGEIHSDEDSLPDGTPADDLSDQSFYDMLDKAANLVGTILFPEAKTDLYRIDAVKKSLNDIRDGVLGELKFIVNDSDLDSETPTRGQRNDETFDEYMDRLQDESEAAGDYDRFEQLRKELVDAKDLAKLRDKLRNIPSSL